MRVSEAGELQGLDLHEHGGPAYPDLYNVGIGERSHHDDRAEAVKRACSRVEKRERVA